MNLLTFPVPLFRTALRNLGRGTRSITCPFGTSRWDGHDELLVAASFAPGRRLLVALSEDLVPPEDLSRDHDAVLTVGTGRRRGQARAFYRRATRRDPIHQLKLVGPGMHCLSLVAMARADESRLPGAGWERWSRTISALGAEVWSRLSKLHYVIVGAGRSGSILADAVASCWGASRVTLIDPDVIQE